MVMYTCMNSVPPVISYSVLKNMQKLRLVASLGIIMNPPNGWDSYCLMKYIDLSQPGFFSVLPLSITDNGGQSKQ